MKLLSLPFFLLYLGLAIAGSMFRMLLTLLPSYTSFFATLGFSGLIGLLYLSSLSSTIPLNWPLLNKINQTRTGESSITQEELDQEIAAWEELRELQPTHRDILVNLARLYEANGSLLKAQDYAFKAHEVDPNNEVFKEMIEESSVTPEL